MADSEEIAVPLFDPSMKKKKKKTKKKLDEEEDGQDVPVVKDEEDASAPADKENKGDTEDSKENKEDDEGEDGLGFDMKKKKKKKKGFEPPVVVEEEEADNDADAGDNDEDAEADADGDADADENGDENDDDFRFADEPPSWLGTDRDYSYPELLTRIFKILDENNPELVRTKRSKIIIKPPTVFREGTKKTVWANFADICNSMNRQQDHMLAYALAELGTSISVDGNNRLVIKGRFNPKQIENVIKHYISDYVMCRTCRSHETNLKKENRLYFVQCVSCGSTRSVAAIKTGFQAQVGKRKRA